MDIRDLGKEPIPGDNPVGEDIKFEPEMEEIEEEIGKLTNLNAEGTTDWDKVLKVGQTILSEKSKNFQVAVYVAHALLETKSMEGFPDGIHILRDIVETYWDTMYPPKKRAKARLNSVNWWKDKTEAMVASWEPVVWPSDKRSVLMDDLTTFDSFLGDNLDDAPILRSLINQVGTIISEEAQPEPEADHEPAAEAPKESEKKPESAKKAPSPKPSLSGSLPPSPVNTSDLSGDQILQHAITLLSHASNAMMQEGLDNPLLYRVNRFAAWMTVNTPPPAEGMQTMIPPPDEQVVGAIRNLYNNQDWRDLIEAAESRIPEFLFWLDLNRYVAEALNGLGLSAASDVVCEETLAYVKRLSGIENLGFSDGMAFADEDTRAWLAELIKASGGGTGEGGSGSAIEKEVEDILKKAYDLLKENKTADALKLVKVGLDKAASGRDRLIWNNAMCKLLLKSGSFRLMIPYIDQVLHLLDDSQVEKWEPGLAADSLELALRGLRKQIGEDTDPETPSAQEILARIESLVNRIAAIDPARALGLL